MKIENNAYDIVRNGMLCSIWDCFVNGGMAVNLARLETMCQNLMEATTQNTDDGFEVKEVDWEELDIDLLMIAGEAVALVMDPRFAELKERWEVKDE